MCTECYCLSPPSRSEMLFLVAEKRGRTATGVGGRGRQGNGTTVHMRRNVHVILLIIVLLNQSRHFTIMNSLVFWNIFASKEMYASCICDFLMETERYLRSQPARHTVI